MTAATPPGHVVRTVKTREDLADLSHYTLQQLSQATRYVFPHQGLPKAIARGEFRGLLTLDDQGNFVRFE